MMMNALEKMKEVISLAEKDAHSFYAKGNKSAGTRLRKAYLQLKGLAAEGRAEVQALRGGTAERVEL